MPCFPPWETSPSRLRCRDGGPPGRLTELRRQRLVLWKGEENTIFRAEYDKKGVKQRKSSRNLPRVMLNLPEN